MDAQELARWVEERFAGEHLLIPEPPSDRGKVVRDAMAGLECGLIAHLDVERSAATLDALLATRTAASRPR